MANVGKKTKGRKLQPRSRSSFQLERVDRGVCGGNPHMFQHRRFASRFLVLERERAKSNNFKPRPACAEFSYTALERTRKPFKGFFVPFERRIAIWLILPVVIRSSQRLSHACLSITIIQENCERLIISVIVSLIVPYYLDTCSNSRANTCINTRLFAEG